MGDRNNPYWGEGMRHAHDGWWGGPFHLLLLLVLLALLVLAAVWLARRLSHGGLGAVAPGALPPAAAGPDPAIAALRMRYASGEVSQEEFRRTLADLTGGETATPAPG